MEEIWKEVNGFEGLYWVSNTGKVKNSRRLLKPGIKKFGYFQVTLIDLNSKYYYKNVHRLVAEAFLDNPENYPVVHHRDNNPQNNQVDNLEWCTHSDNVNYCIRAGRRPEVYGTKNPMCKVSDEVIQKVFELRKAGLFQWQIANLTNLSRAYISEVLSGKKRSRSVTV